MKDRCSPELMLRAPFYSYQKFDLAALPGMLADRHFRNALWLASPVFYGLIKAKDFDWEQLDEKARFTLAKYFNRMCFRPTPFGSFASFTLLEWGTGRVGLSAEGEARLTLLPDLALSKAAFRIPSTFNSDTPVRVSPSLYRLGRSYRYFRTGPGAKGRHTFSIGEADAVRFNKELLAFIGTGTRTAAEVCGWMMARTACPLTEAEDHLRYLLEDQLLITPAQGHIIAPDHYPEYPERFWADWKERALDTIGELTDTVYNVAELFAGQGPKKAYYYAALERPHLSGGPDGQTELAGALEALQALSQPIEQRALSAFANEFRRRFDRARVPLLLALDPDAGIVYDDRIAVPDEGLLGGIRFPEKPAVAKHTDWSAIHQLFLQKWLQKERSTSAPVHIGPQDLPERREAFPPSMSVMFRKVSQGLLIEQAAGASATQLGARFSLFSEPVQRYCLDLARLEAEANPDVIFADIGQLSDAYVDNINRRKATYPYELVINTFSELPDDRKIHLADLVLSLRGEELILECRRSGRRVIPRLASAFNYHHNELALFRFLCDLQYQGLSASPGLDLSRLYPGLNHYPRVVYDDKVILGTAKWVMTGTEIRSLSDEAAVTRLRRERGIPALISLGDGDQQLVLDLDVPEQTGLFLRYSKSREQVVLTEYLLPDDSLTAEGRPLAGQYIASWVNQEQVYRQMATGSQKIWGTVHQFAPGSDWLYIKLYCTRPGADVLLREVVAHVLNTHRRRITQWFFIRYADPGHHLRLRLRVNGPESGVILAALHARLKRTGHDNLISDLVCDTYRPEIERYGANYIRGAEAVFQAGSELCLSLPEDGDEFLQAVRTTDRMILAFSPELKGSLLTEMVAAFFKEFHADKAFRLELDTAYRDLRPKLAAYPGHPMPELERGLLELARSMSKETPDRKRRMLADLIHMQLNRQFSHGQRQQELLVYHCLQKQYASDKARSTKGHVH